MNANFFGLVGMAAVGVTLAHCGFEQDGCLDDSACKHGRVCSQGICVTPPPDRSTSAVQAGSGAPEPGAWGVAGQGGAGGIAGGETGSQPGDGQDALTDTTDTDDNLADASYADPPSADGGSPDPGPAPIFAGKYLCDPSGEGACQNLSDCPIIVDPAAEEAAKECGIGCVTSPNPTCAQECILAGTDLSQPCTSCLDAFFNCLIAQCLGPCLAGTAEDCADCGRTRPAGNSCSAQWYACSGTELNPGYQGQ